MPAEGMQSHDQSCGNCPTASHPATKKGRINAPILPKPARCAKSDRLLEVLIERNMLQMSQVLGRERIPSRPQTRDLAKAVAHRTLQARHGSFFSTVEEKGGAL